LEKQSAIDRETATLEPGNLAGVRYLIVDDNTTNRTILHYQLSGWQMRGTGSVASGREALAVLRQAARIGEPCQIAFLDMQMPEMDGLTLARTIKSEPAIANTHLVLLTSMCHRMNSTEMQAAGIAAYLVKPVKQSQLLRSLLRVLAEAPAFESAIPSNNAPPVHHWPHDLRLLLAEDNVVNQRLALRQLRKLGFHADAVANGLEVLESLRNIPYEIVIMDCHMPEMDGYEATRRIRQNPELNRTRYGFPVCIIAMTADAMKGDREKCLEIGMDDYVSKPVRMEELKSALEKSITRFAESSAVSQVEP
jgi:two-component system, sensor histidine kinase and response regulator